jgi:spore maturation protein CgeB
VSARVPLALVIGEFSAGALAGYYARALEMLGWHVVRYDMDRGYTRGRLLANARPLRRMLRRPVWALMAREAAALARRHRPQLILVTKAPFLGPESVRRLRQGGAPVAMIYPDSPYGAYTQRNDMLDVLGAYDRVFIWGHQLVSRLRGDGVASSVYLPFAFDPADYASEGPAATPSCGRTHAIVFIGQRYDKRDTWLAALAGLDVGVWGLGWERSAAIRSAGHCLHRDPARGAAVAALYRGARVALNVLLQDNVPAHNMRTFEIPPCGTAMLSEATAEIESFFEPERACLVASDPGALRAQAERLLADAALARAVGQGGVRAAAPHTYQARARTILADLGLAAPRSSMAGGGA